MLILCWLPLSADCYRPCHGAYRGGDARAVCSLAASAKDGPLPRRAFLAAAAAPGLLGAPGLVNADDRGSTRAGTAPRDVDQNERLRKASSGKSCAFLYSSLMNRCD